MWYSVPHTRCMPSMVLIVSLYFRAAQQRLQSGVIISLQNPLSGVGQVQQLQECCCLEKALAAWGSTGRTNSRCFFPGKTRPPQKWEHAKENTCQSGIVFKQMTGNKAGICLDCEQEWVKTLSKALVPLPGCPQHNPACCTWGTQPKDRLILSRCVCEEIRKGKFCSWSLSNSTKQAFFFFLVLSVGVKGLLLFQIGASFALYAEKTTWSSNWNADLNFSLNSSRNNLTLHLQSSWLIAWYHTWIDQRVWSFSRHLDMQKEAKMLYRYLM